MWDPSWTTDPSGAHAGHFKLQEVTFAQLQLHDTQAAHLLVNESMHFTLVHSLNTSLNIAETLTPS